MEQLQPFGFHCNEFRSQISPLVHSVAPMSPGDFAATCQSPQMQAREAAENTNFPRGWYVLMNFLMRRVKMWGLRKACLYSWEMMRFSFRSTHLDASLAGSEPAWQIVQSHVFDCFHVGWVQDKVKFFHFSPRGVQFTSEQYPVPLASTDSSSRVFANTPTWSESSSDSRMWVLTTRQRCSKS